MPNNAKKQLVIGILAHVDAGKTTLVEGLLYTAGQLRRLGRVDHRDAFLDTDPLERQRGITVFSKQATLTLGDTSITLLDTPGHTDLSAEMERTLAVLDYAVLVISGSEGIQSHTRTLWQLLRRHRIPTFIFINKMDLPNEGRTVLLHSLEKELSGNFLDFQQSANELQEALALCDERLMEEYLSPVGLHHGSVCRAIAAGLVYPVFFGSALKLDGIQALEKALDHFTLMPAYGNSFGARVFRLSEDSQGAQLVHVKVTGGILKVKDILQHQGKECGKADQLRIYSGTKYVLSEQLLPGSVCAITGLSGILPGFGLGSQEDSVLPMLEPVMQYRALPNDPLEGDKLLVALRKMGAEDPGLHVSYQSSRNGINVQLMGEVQRELLASQLERRFHLSASFVPAGIVYKETIQDSIMGYGHFEPLRHYAEVHLRLDPLPRGSGLQFKTECSEDLLDRNWQRLILTHLEERSFPGVLCGFPVTDICFTVVSGKAHLKHTEGGDFRQATYRAVRQGLRSAKSILLEPWYAFTLQVPTQQLGRAMADMTKMGANFALSSSDEEMSTLTGELPVSEFGEYPREVTAYTGGLGKIGCMPCGYRPCHNPEQVMTAIGYDCDADYENTADSVFCSHGSGDIIRWDDAPAHMHIKDDQPKDDVIHTQEQAERVRQFRSNLEMDKELMRIFERTYGPIKQNPLSAMRPKAEVRMAENGKIAPSHRYQGTEYLLVDGYNIIFAWEELSTIAKDSIDAARGRLIDTLCSYRGYHGGELILVFDAYRVHGNPGTMEKTGGITVVYTKEAETADAFIVKASFELSKDNLVRVATSDSMEQMIILGNGALRVSAREFHSEVLQAERVIRSLLDRPVTTRHMNLDGIQTEPLEHP